MNLRNVTESYTNFMLYVKKQFKGLMSSSPYPDNLLDTNHKNKAMATHPSRFLVKAKIYCDTEHIAICVILDGYTRYINISKEASLLDLSIKIASEFDVTHGSIAYRSVLLNDFKPISFVKGLSLCDYNICDGDHLKFIQGLLGGSLVKVGPKAQLPVSMSVITENEFVSKRTCPVHNDTPSSRLRVQTDDSSHKFFNECVKDHVKTCLKTLTGDTSKSNVYFYINVIESYMLMYNKILESESKKDFLQNMLILYKMTTKCTLTEGYFKVMKLLFQGNVQSDDSFDDLLEIFRHGFKMKDTIENHPLVEKFTKCFSFLLTQGFLSGLGFHLSEEDYSRFEIKRLRSTFSSPQEMWFHILETAFYVLERYNDYRKTGDFSSFLHTEDSYVTWLEVTDKLITLSDFTANLEPHNISYFEFLCDVDSQIESGEAMCRYSYKSNSSQNLMLRNKVNKLKLIKANEVTRKSAQQERQAPFAVLLHGGSSVGKSTLTKLMFYFYGNLFNLPTDDHYRFVRNSADEFWSGFDTSKWCIQLDDIGFLNPEKAMEDRTLMDLLNIINNVPYNPPQAALEDKGKSPVKCDFVIATTNAKDLNAHHYFHCPLAIMRRFPFIVKVEPKPVYRHENGRFIDPKKLVRPGEGYPDYWVLTVQKVEPVCGRRDFAVLVDDAVYSDINLFLQDFGKSAKHHKEIQLKSMGCDRYMSEITICKNCMLVSAKCECLHMQAEDDEFIPSVWITTPKKTMINYLQEFYFYVFNLWYSFSWNLYFLHIACRFNFLKRVICLHLVPFLTERAQIRFLGTLADMNKDKRLEKLCAVIGLFIGGYTLYKCISPLKYNTHKEEEEKETNLEVQGNILSPEAVLKRETDNNVWYNPTVEITKFDLPIASQSLAGVTDEKLRDKLADNIVRLCVITEINDEKVCRWVSGVMIKGSQLLTNNHAFPKGRGVYEIELIMTTSASGVSPNIHLRLNESDIARNPTKDVCMILVRGIPPKKDITKFWSTQLLRVSRGLVLRRERDGSLKTFNVFNGELSYNMPIMELDTELDVILTRLPIETKQGDCGSLLINVTPRGPILCGLHVVGYQERAGFLYVDRGDLEDLENRLNDRFGKYVLCAGGEPSICAKDITNRIGSIHAKSIVRYFEGGALLVRGGLTGFRPKPKSHVAKTPWCDKICDEFNYEVAHCAPEMRSWKPWHNNVKEMIKMNFSFDRSILRKATLSFMDDIKTGLPEGWESQVCVLSNRSAINGIPGVKFVDGINRNSSMGYPWCCSKKKFLVADPSPEYPEGVTFTDEIMQRINIIEEKYLKGERYYPVFNGHLKDEPVTFAKRDIGKTRMFTGAPADWSIVVRKYLLTVVKLIQDNKFVFEAAPGTNCMSYQWTEIHNYLTAFGPNRNVAGDYGKYDKRMAADFMLAAYDIVATICSWAGFSDDEIKVVWGIATDTSYPLVNVNGDLLEFYGTNPSGHPLTVIINSLVNSLYMRYCYIKLSQDGECTNFKKDVHLLTYGDDNDMGVVETNNWFNHTNIQRVLGEIGVEYTMADKTSASVPFIDFKDCEFLKRTWRYEEDLKAYACPLNESSILKSLTVWLPSKTICSEEQFVNTIISANNEYFFHGKERFEKAHLFFLSLMEDKKLKCFLPLGGLPTWDCLVNRFNSSSVRPDDKQDV